MIIKQDNDWTLLVGNCIFTILFLLFDVVEHVSLFDHCEPFSHARMNGSCTYPPGVVDGYLTSTLMIINLMIIKLTDSLHMKSVTDHSDDR